ncbi:hypothetical protein [Nonomuraea lactucae]|uniref:hypothetical protein n=1 Tax=Nonomuraea lactucae TaxID=2249762 RepID=UPI0013B3E42C|nr:hypothetical protein [Nonomuraea lactucae]
MIYNAVGPSLAKTSDWLRFTARRNFARDVLAALKASNLLVIPAPAVARVRADERESAIAIVLDALATPGAELTSDVQTLVDRIRE